MPEQTQRGWLTRTAGGKEKVKIRLKCLCVLRVARSEGGLLHRTEKNRKILKNK